MPDPANDEEKPFSYLRFPNTQFAIPGEDAATQVTPEGNLWNGFAEYFVTAGDPPVSIEWRCRVFRDGWIPIIESTCAWMESNMNSRLLWRR